MGYLGSFHRCCKYLGYTLNLFTKVSRLGMSEYPRSIWKVRISDAPQPQQSRHRLVYQAVEELMHSDIHALSIRAYTPEEH